MTRCDLDEWLEPEESETPLHRTLKVLLVYATMLYDTIIDMHERQRNECLHVKDVVANRDLDVVKCFMGLLIRHELILY